MRVLHRPRLTALLPALAILAFVVALAPGAARACSCVGPDDIVKMIPTTPQLTAFTGSPGLPTPQGVPVTVTSWYGGPAPAAVVSLEVQGGDGASCGRDAPPAGPDYLFVTWRGDDGRLGLSLCDIAVELDTAEGRRLQEMVTAVAGPPSEVTAQPPPTTGDPAALLASLAPTGLALLVGFLVVAGLFVWVSRREID